MELRFCTTASKIQNITSRCRSTSAWPTNPDICNIQELGILKHASKLAVEPKAKHDVN
jgi:hypothetical protein